MEDKKMPKGWKVVTYDDVQKKKTKEELEEEDYLGQFHETPIYRKSYKTGKNDKGFFVSHYYSSSEPYWKRNLLPFLLEAAFILTCFYLPARYIIYTAFAFYASLLAFFLITKSFSFKSWFITLKEGLYFWREVCVTAMLFCAAFAITEGMENLFPSLITGEIEYPLHSPLEIIIFAVTSIILMPITEECYFRQGLISGESKKMLLLTSVVSMILYAICHAFAPWGIFLCILWAIPLTWAYLKTRNIYIVTTAHFIINIIGNLPTIFMAIFR